MNRTPAADVADRWLRIPKPVLFGLAGLLQLALLALMVADRVEILRAGTEVKLNIRPIDPRDFLRGDYVTLSYEISQLPAGALKDQPVGTGAPIVFVTLVPNAEGVYEAVSVHAAPVPVNSPEVLIRGRVTYGANCGSGERRFCDQLQIRYNLESYFVPEGEGGQLERARDQHKLMVVAAVLPSGRAAIKRLLVDGAPVYDEPWF
jgi:uncharacterized membrane-anchored protein